MGQVVNLLRIVSPAFVALTAADERPLLLLERQRRAERFFERGLARLTAIGRAMEKRESVI